MLAQHGRRASRLCKPGAMCKLSPAVRLNRTPPSRTHPGRKLMHHRSLLASLALLTGLALWPSASTAQQVRLRYAHVGSEGDIQYWFAEEAAKKIPQVTE